MKPSDRQDCPASREECVFDRSNFTHDWTQTRFPISVLRPWEPLTSSADKHERSHRAQALLDAYRLSGHLIARVDPLERREIQVPPSLDPSHYGLATDPGSCATDYAGGTEHSSVAQLMCFLRDTYCGSAGLDCAHVRDETQRRWLFRQMESDRTWRFDPASRERIFAALVAAQSVEQEWGRLHPESKRFSLEGCETLIPLLHALFASAAELGAGDIVMGMPHRGRLNVLANVFGMPSDQLRSLFEGTPHPGLNAWDLKYHLGHTGVLATPHGSLRVFLAHNPSHLESVSPIVCGIARAMQDKVGEHGARLICPVILHGDAAFCGQGVVMETFSLSQTAGYTTGGSVHVLINNQIGFTAEAQAIRSSRYCSDVARMIDAPVWHCNADDPEAAIAAVRMAVEFRYKYRHDVIVDLTGYRRRGHNEQDDPRLTQPLMQMRIDAHPRVSEIYFRKLRYVDRQEEGNRRLLADSHAAPATPATLGIGPIAPCRSRAAADLSATRCAALIERLVTVPQDFALHPALVRKHAAWRQIAAGSSISVDWCLAENLAYACLVEDGHPVRISGMDVGRGTFWHRLAVWHNQASGARPRRSHVPLAHIAPDQAPFRVHDSPLSEEAVLGFEYGYSLRASGLVVWEAQFGDFVNNAQTIIDAYVASGEEKWGCRSRLVVLLPHGYEGSGPEHSSAFLGRFLALCAAGNQSIIVPSTSAQLFHALRTQALRTQARPLIVFTPKTWLYGHPASHSTLPQFLTGHFRALIAEPVRDAAAISRVVLVAGKLFYELREQAAPAAAQCLVIRVEQLYPFPAGPLAEHLASLPNLREVVWAQEEAKNHGAWHHVRDAIADVMPSGVTLRYAGREAAPAAATCRMDVHRSAQRAIIANALGRSEHLVEPAQ
jgi:2-oxoglutarate dehydrogenase E1 component